jgi:hypothetical protein
MGMFDYIRCEMPLPVTPEPPPDGEFQTKDTPAQYLDNYKITRDGRLLHEQYDMRWEEDAKAPLGIWQRRDGKRWVEVPFHGDIEFGTISLHRGQFTGGDWDYLARFTEGVCASIQLVNFSPTDPERVAKIEAEWQASLAPPRPEGLETGD